MTDRVREFYDADPEREWERTRSGPYHRLEFEVIHRLILPRILSGPSRILDLGCGPGTHAVELAGQGHTLTLADLSRASLDAAVERFRARGLESRIDGASAVDATAIEVPPGHYDAVLLFGPLYHLLDDDASRECVERAANALRPGGSLLAIFLTRTSVIRDLIKLGRFTEIDRLLANGYLDHGQYEQDPDDPIPGYLPSARTYRRAEAEAELRRAGMGIEGVYSLESVAAWMRPYVDRVGELPSSFEALCEIVCATSQLPELIEAGDHFLVSAVKPAESEGT